MYMIAPGNHLLSLFESWRMWGQFEVKIYVPQQLPGQPDGQSGSVGTTWPPGRPVILPLVVTYIPSVLLQIYGKNYPLSQLHLKPFGARFHPRL